MLENILTEEEKEFLAKIQQKYTEHLSSGIDYTDELEQYVDSKDIEKFNIAEPTKHLTVSNKEILIKLLAEVSEINEKNELIDVRVCLDNFYHIPVPANTDYEPVLNAFVKSFEEHIQDCATKIHKNDE